MRSGRDCGGIVAEIQLMHAGCSIMHAGDSHARACQMKGVSGAVGRIRATSARPLPSPPGRTGARGEAPVFNTDVEPVRQALIPLEEPPGTTAPAKLPCGADRPRCLARIMQPQRKPGVTDRTAACRRVSDWRPWARHVEPQIAFARGGERTVTVGASRSCREVECRHPHHSKSRGFSAQRRSA